MRKRMKHYGSNKRKENANPTKQLRVTDFQNDKDYRKKPKGGFYFAEERS